MSFERFDSELRVVLAWLRTFIRTQFISCLGVIKQFGTKKCTVSASNCSSRKKYYLLRFNPGKLLIVEREYDFSLLNNCRRWDNGKNNCPSRNFPFFLRLKSIWNRCPANRSPSPALREPRTESSNWRGSFRCTTSSPISATISRRRSFKSKPRSVF